jgi:hypothetical protein
MVATSDFSGLVSSACALARAAAIAPIVSLDRCIAIPMGEEIEADGARVRTFGPNAVAGGHLGVLRHQGFELRLCPLMVEKSRSRGAEEASELPHELDSLMSTMRTASIRGRGAGRRA